MLAKLTAFKIRFSAVGTVVSLGLVLGLSSWGALHQTHAAEAARSQNSVQNKCDAVPSLAKTQIELASDKYWGTAICGSPVKTSKNVEFVFFVIEGACGNSRAERKGSCGNNWKTYMVAVVNGQAVEAIQIGGKTGFSAIRDELKLQDNVLFLPGFDYQPGDASCCPTQPTTRKFKIIDGAFVEDETG